MEHLWFSSKAHHASSSARVDGDNNVSNGGSGGVVLGNGSSHASNNNPDDDEVEDNLTVMADKRLYKLVKWCKSLPLFKSILVSFICSTYYTVVVCLHSNKLVALSYLYTARVIDNALLVQVCLCFRDTFLVSGARRRHAARYSHL